MYGVYMTSTTRTYVRHAGDHDAEWMAERDRQAYERHAELEARIAAQREAHSDIVAAAEAKMLRRRR